MGWRVALSLEVLLEQLNEAAPFRSKISDGSIGDPAHSSRESDHNPNPLGVVCARDFTHDPANNADMNEWAEALRASRDPRIKYVIWNRRIFSSTEAPWIWRAYSGINPHDHHMHVSVQGNYDLPRKWATPQQKEWSDLATEAEFKKIVNEAVDNAVKKVKEELVRQRKLLAVGEERAYDPKKVCLSETCKCEHG